MLIDYLHSFHSPLGYDSEFVLDYLAFILTKSYDSMLIIPRWLMVMLSGGIASVCINLLHTGFGSYGKKKEKAAQDKAAELPAPSAPAGTAAVSGSKSNPSGSSVPKQRKSGKR